MSTGKAWSVILLTVTTVGLCAKFSAGRAAALTVSPNSISYPESAKPFIARTYWIILTNSTPADISIQSATGFEDSTKGPGAGPTGWMLADQVPAIIPASGADSLRLVLNHQGVIQTGPTVLFGRLRLIWGSPTDSLDLPISFIIADTIAVPVWDTISTACVDLTVGTNGNMGQNGIGYVNLDFVGSPSECDTGLNSRGDATIYLRDASPIIIRQPSPGVYRGSWSLYDDGYASPHGFKPVTGAGYAPHGSFSTTSYDGFNSGTFLTVDSIVKCEVTWYAPKSADSCNFIIQRLRVFPATIGSPVTNLQIGLYYDFDLPSDSGNNANVGGTDCLYRMAWQRGFNSADGQSDCADNSTRYAGVGSILWFMKDKNCFDSLYSARTIGVDRLTDPSGQLIPDSLSNVMHLSGYTSDTRVTNQASIFTIKDGPNGYTLPATETLTVYSALVSVRDAASTSAGLDSLKRATQRARQFILTNLNICSSCCVGRTGNVNMSGIVDLADLSALVSYLTGGGYVLPCYGEANINAVGVVDLSDLSHIVCLLTGGDVCPLPNCPLWPFTGPGCQ